MRSVCIALDYSIIYLEIMQALFCNFPIFFTFFFPVAIDTNGSNTEQDTFTVFLEQKTSGAFIIHRRSFTL